MNETLKKIASCLSDIDVEDLTDAELQICKILEEAKYLVRAKGDEEDHFKLV